MANETIHPLGNRILVKRKKIEKTKGGILLPDTAKEKPKEGCVVAVGPGKRNQKGEIEPMQVKMGDCVIFSSYAGTEVKGLEEGEEFLILSEEDIFGVVQN